MLMTQWIIPYCVSKGGWSQLSNSVTKVFLLCLHMEQAGVAGLARGK